jgi:hypothetical protein
VGQEATLAGFDQPDLLRRQAVLMPDGLDREDARGQRRLVADRDSLSAKPHQS